MLRLRLLSHYTVCIPLALLQPHRGPTMASFWATGQSMFRPMELMPECKNVFRLKTPRKLHCHYRFPSFRLSNDADAVGVNVSWHSA